MRWSFAKRLLTGEGYATLVFGSGLAGSVVGVVHQLNHYQPETGKPVIYNTAKLCGQVMIGFSQGALLGSVIGATFPLSLIYLIHRRTN